MSGIGNRRRLSFVDRWRGALLRFCARVVMHTEIRDGITLRVYDVEDDDTLQMLHLALDLIEEHSPWIYSQIPRHLTGGVGIQTALGAIATFRQTDRSCDIDEDWIAEAWPDEVASTIIHELTHARIWVRGIDYVEKYRFRIEKICVCRELAFVRRLPDSADLVEVKQHRLDNMDVDEYTNAAMHHRMRYKRRVAFRHWRKMGMSRRAIRIMVGMVYILSLQFLRRPAVP